MLRPVKKTRRKVAVTRKIAKLHRMAYEFEADASALRADGHEAFADAVAAIASQCGNTARWMRDKL